MYYIGFDTEWKALYYKNYKTKYEISNFGDIRIKKSGKLLKQFYLQSDKNRERKYKFVRISYKDENDEKHSKTVSVHRLVAETFIPIPDKYIELGFTKKTLSVDHIRDDDPDNHEDNSIYNLQWLPIKENILKAKKAGRYRKTKLIGTKQPTWSWMVGENNANNKYSDNLVHNICKEIELNRSSVSEIALKFNVTKTFIQDLLSHKARTYITKNYNIDIYDVIEGKTHKYHRSDLEMIRQLILNGKSNTEIKQIMNLDKDSATANLLCKYRNQLKNN